MSQSISPTGGMHKLAPTFKQPAVVQAKATTPLPSHSAENTGAASVLDQISRQWAQLNSRLQTRISQMGGANGELIKVQMDVNSINLTTQAATQLGEGLSQTVKRLAQVANG